MFFTRDAVVPEAEMSAGPARDPRAVVAGAHAGVPDASEDVRGEDDEQLEAERDDATWIVLSDDEVADAKASPPASPARDTVEPAQQQQSPDLEPEQQHPGQQEADASTPDASDSKPSSAGLAQRRPRASKSGRNCKDGVKQFVAGSRVPWDEIVGIAVGVSAILGGIYLCNKFSPPDESAWRGGVL